MADHGQRAIWLLSAPLLALLTTLVILERVADAVDAEVMTWELSRRFVDDASFVEHAVRQYQPATRSLVFLGGSVTREGLTAESQMEKFLQEAGVRELEVRNLAWSSFSPVEAIAVADTLRIPVGSIVAVQLSWQNLTESRADLDRLVRRPRIANLDWTSILDEASLATRMEVAVTPSLIRHSAIIANYLQQRACTWYRLFRSPERQECLRDLPVQRNFYSPDTRQSGAEKVASVAVAHAELFSAAMRNHAYAERMYGLFARRALARGFRPVLVVFPRDHSEATAMARRHLDELENAVVVRLERHVAVIDLRKSDGLLPEDFADPLHLLESGRSKIGKPLAEQLAAIIAPAPQETYQ